MQQPDPTFPPLLNGIAVEGAVDPFDGACAAAAGGTAEAGNFYWARSTSDLKLAIVLEPEVTASRSLHMILALMVAYGDAFGSIGPPEVGVFYRWPSGLIVNDAQIGSVRAALPTNSKLQDTPDWLVVGLHVRMARGNVDGEPGYDLENTTLEDEGCGDLTQNQLVEAVARHFLVWVHTWTEEGFKPVCDAWLSRAEKHAESVSVKLGDAEHRGQFIGLDDDGNMLLKPEWGDAVALALIDTVERY